MNELILQRGGVTPPPAFRQAAAPCTSCSTCPGSCSRQIERQQLQQMQQAFGRTGGLVSGDEAAALLRGQSAQPISMLARWIVSRSIVSFQWQSQTLVPLFQFDRGDMSMAVSAADVVRELVDVFDDWELALWFAQPNAWLNDAAPCELMAGGAGAVLQAARADRFVARG